MKFHVLGMGFCVLLHGAPAQAWADFSDDETCRIGQSWELGTTMFISKPKAPEGNSITGDLMSDEVVIYAANDDWASLQREDDQDIYADYVIRFEDEYGNWIENTPMIGNHSFFLVTNLEWLERFRNSGSMLVTRDGRKVGQFSWWDFSIQLGAFQRCIERARAPIAERERQERLRKETPVDPFAN